MYFRRVREYARFLRSLSKTITHLLWGMWKLTKLPHPAITIFGGARIPKDSIHAKMATELAKKLAGDGFSIITGGGPGIMEAANQGAIEYIKECNINSNACINKVVSAGIGLIHLNMEKSNPYVQDNIVMEHFFSRKWLLVRYSVGFIVFPGGFGTMDELFELVTLVQCNRMAKVPILLIDSGYWQPLMDWVDHRALMYQMISPEDRDIMTLVNTVDEAYDIIRARCFDADQSILSNGNDKNGIS